MQFRYRARGADGSLQDGTVEAADRAGALVQLQQNGLFVFGLDPVRRGLRLDMQINLLPGAGRVKPADLAAFCGQFASLIGAGVPILQVLSVLAAQFKGRKLATILEAVAQSIASGKSMSQAMREHQADLPATLIYITGVAELSGRLDEAYALLARQFEQDDHLSRKVRSALTYPGVVMGVAVCVVIFMLTFVLPTYAGMFAQMGANLPASTQLLMDVSDFVKRWWMVLPFIPLLLWLGARQAVKDERVRTFRDRITLRLPVWGQVRYKAELTRLCRTLGTMHRSGVPLLSALNTLREASELRPIRRALDQVLDRVADGESLGNALRAQPVFDRISVEMIALGEAAGTLEAMLFRVAETAERDVNTTLERLTALLEPALTVVLGGLVLGIIVPMLLPMFDILGQVH